ncbi:LOW QUALITY PROTEIN: hypothetical protein KUTeg_021815 [Tegillarca granosa]|uniref:Uncharacterized protein n=1 Tax=Tegillarca granosa TaxID=220873 RepID=A0ABQ9E930_TEGGR|nr:LOW QUALITY PROTEIN: hypothetical protein KUTeg_021815 [Tegillarca granosa]
MFGGELFFFFFERFLNYNFFFGTFYFFIFYFFFYLFFFFFGKNPYSYDIINSLMDQKQEKFYWPSGKKHCHCLGTFFFFFSCHNIQQHCQYLLNLPHTCLPELQEYLYNLVKMFKIFCCIVI